VEASEERIVLSPRLSYKLEGPIVEILLDQSVLEKTPEMPLKLSVLKQHQFPFQMRFKEKSRVNYKAPARKLQY
jgi:hypothetical protein